MNSYSKGVLAIFLISVNLKFNNAELFEGSLCTLHDDSAGECIPFRSCDWLTLQLETGQMTQKQIVSCGFKNSEPLICCKSKTLSATYRKSDVACDLISKLKFPDFEGHFNYGLPVISGEFPYVAAIGYKEIDNPDIEYRCAGNLISSKFILTAAHCVIRKSTRPVKIKLGRISLHPDILFDGEEDVDIGVQQVIIHPNYTSGKYYNDIALIELETPVPKYSNSIHPVCLFNGLDQNILIDSKLLVAGWGAYAKGKNVYHVMVRGVSSLVPDKECFEEYENAKTSKLDGGIQSGQICAYDHNKDEKRVDTCQSDSGGPLELNVGLLRYLVGVSSFGTCGGTPTVYTRVSSYLDWIESVVWPGEVTI